MSPADEGNVRMHIAKVEFISEDSPRHGLPPSPQIPEALRERMKSGGAKRARMPQPKRGNLEATDESSHRRRRFLAFR